MPCTCGNAKYGFNCKCVDHKDYLNLNTYSCEICGRYDSIYPACAYCMNTSSVKILINWVVESELGMEEFYLIEKDGETIFTDDTVCTPIKLQHLTTEALVEKAFIVAGYKVIQKIIKGTV